ncbi:MAG: phage head closure protein [Anaerotignaceae bacterium]
MTYDNELTLITKTYAQDDIGNQIATETETKILCGVKSVGRSEFYNAAQTGLKPTLLFIVHGYEYSGEKLVKFENEKYSVLKTYSMGFEELELTCERVIANG